MIKLAAIYWYKVFYYQVCMYICITQVHIRIWIYPYVSMHIHVLFKALPPVCMKYTAQGQSGVAKIARGKVKCYICHKTLTKSRMLFIQIK